MRKKKVWNIYSREDGGGRTSEGLLLGSYREREVRLGF